MTADLALYAPDTLAAKVEYCKLLADSGLLPDAYRAKPANVLYAVEYGESVGIPTMAAINGVHVIKGKPTASAGLVGALVRCAGHKLRVKGNDTTARAVIVRADDPGFEFESVWTLERAVQAGLCTLRDGKPYARDDKGRPTSWEKYPAAMLKARATTEVARDACEEVLFGLHYTPEELGAEVDEDGVPVAVPIVSQDTPPAAAPPEPVRVDDAEIVPDPAPQPVADAAQSAPRMISEGQNRALHALLTAKHGKLTDEQRHDGFTRFTRRTVTSAKQLTYTEAGNLIDALSKLPDLQPEQPTAAPTPMPQAADGNENFRQAQALLKLEEQQDHARIALEDDILDAIQASENYGELTSAMNTATAARDDGRLTREQFTKLAQAADQRAAAGARTAVPA